MSPLGYVLCIALFALLLGCSRGKASAFAPTATLRKLSPQNSQTRLSVSRHRPPPVGDNQALPSRDDGDDDDASESKELYCIDTTPYQEHRDVLLDWLDSLTCIERSEPEWIQGDDILRARLSPSLLVQEHLDSLFLSNQKSPSSQAAAPRLFPTLADQAKFDFQWRHGLFSKLPRGEITTFLADGTSNTHPLRLQLVACPRDQNFSLHVHPAVELDIPLVGDLYERRATLTALPKDQLSRRVEHLVGAQGGLFQAKPTAENLKAIAHDLAQRVVFEEQGHQGAFSTKRVRPGQALVNEVGSVHQSFTGPASGCLLFVLGPNVHAHFLAGHFRQRTGIDQLREIDDLLRAG